MDKSATSSRGVRQSLSRIDEESVWERSINSSGSEELESFSPEPEKTPEKAKQKIQSLEEVVTNVQLDYETLKEYTVLERQVLNSEKLADLSLTQPDILASLFNRSLAMDQSCKSFTALDTDPDECTLSQSNAGDSSVNIDFCQEELQIVVKNLKVENEKLKAALEEREKALLNEKLPSTETSAVADLQLQIENLSQQNKEYKDRIESLIQLKQNCTDKNLKVDDLLRQIEQLKDENVRLRQEVESHQQLEDSSEDSSSEENFRVHQLLERQKNLQNQRDTLKNAEASLKAELEAAKQQIEEQDATLQRMKVEFQLPENSDVLSSLREYVIGLSNSGSRAENIPYKVELPDETLSLLKSQIEDLTQQLEDAKKLTVAPANPKLLTIGSDMSNSFDDRSIENLLAEIQSYNSEIEGLKSNIQELEMMLETKNNTISTLEESIINKDCIIQQLEEKSDHSTENLLAKINSYCSEIEGLKSNVHELEEMLKTKDTTIVTLEDTITDKDCIIRQLECKTNVLTSYMSFLTKHIENVTNNNNMLFLQLKEKCDRVIQLENHLQGVKKKFGKFADQKDTELDISNFFYNLFDMEEDSSENNTSTSLPSEPLNQSVANVLATPKSFLDFSMCLNNLFATNSVSSRSVGLDSWLNETSNYFHQLFESVHHNDSTADAIQDRSLADATDYFIHNLFKAPSAKFPDASLNGTCVSDQTFDTSNYWYTLFDSFQSKMNKSQIDNSQLNTTNMFGNLFKSRNSLSNSLNETAKTPSKSNLSLLYHSQAKHADQSLNSSDAVNLSVFKNMNEHQFSLSESMENQLLTSYDASSRENSKADLMKSNIVQPEIALCDGTLNSSAMFNGNYTCSEDPLKSFCADSTLIEGSSGFLSETLATEESEYDLLMSPQSLLKKIVNLKILLNQFENGVEEISGRKIDISSSSDPFVCAFNVLMKSYRSAYDVLKSLIKSFNLDNLVPEELEIPIQEPTNLTSKYEAVEKKLYDLSVDLNDVTSLMSGLEDQINLETVASKTLTETIIQKESHLQDLKNSSETSHDEPEVPDNILALEKELVALKSTLRVKEEKIRELSCKMEELKDKNVSEVQRCCHDLQAKTVHTDGILNGFVEELEKIEIETTSWKEKVSFLLMELNMQNLLLTHSHKFEEIEKQFTSIGGDFTGPSPNTVQDIKELLVRLLDRKAYAEETLLDLLSEVGVLKSVMESKETGLINQLQKQEAKIKELSEWKIDQMRSKTQDLDLDLSVKEESLQNLLEQIGGFNEDKEYYETEMIKFMKQIDSLTADLEDKDAEMSFLKEDWRVMLEETKEILKQNMLEVIIAEKVSQESRVAVLISQLTALQSQEEMNSLKLQALDEKEANLLAVEEQLTNEKALCVKLKSQVEQLEGDLERRSQELSQALQEIDGLKSELECTDTKIKNLQSEVDNFESLKQSLSELMEKNSLHQEKNADLSKQLEIMLANKNGNETKIEDLTEKLKFLEANEAENIRKIAGLSEKLSSSEAEALYSKKQAENLEEELSVLKESKALFELKVTGLEKELAFLKEKEGKGVLELSDLMEELNTLKLEKSQIKQENNELAEKLEILRVNEADIQQKVIKLEETLKISETNEAESKVKIVELELEVTTLKSNKEEITQQIIDLNEELSASKMKEAEVEQENVNLVEELKVLKDSDGQSKLQIANLEEELSILRASEAENISKILLLESELSALKVDKTESGRQIAELTEELNTMRNLAQSNSGVADIVEELNTLKKDNEQLNETRLEQLEKMQAQLVKVEEQLNDKVSIAAELESKLQSIEADRKQFEDRVNQMMEETDKLKEESKILANLAEDNSVKEQCIKDLTSQLEAQKEAAEERLEEVCLKLNETESELEEKQMALDSIQKKYEACTAEKAHLEKELKALQDESSTLAAVKSDLAKLTEDNAAKDKRIEEALSQLRNFEIEKKQNVHLPEVMEQTELKLAKTELELKEKEQLVSDLEEDKKYLEEALMKLMKEVDNLKAQSDSSKQREEGKSAEENNECTETDKDEKLSGHLSALHMKLDDEEELISHLKDKLNKLSVEKSEKEAEISMLLEKLDNYQAKVENQLNEIDRLTKATLDQQCQTQQNGPLSITVLSEDISSKHDDEIKRLLQEISALSEANTKLKVEQAVLIEEKSDEMKNLEKIISDKTEELAQVLSEVEASKQLSTESKVEVEKIKMENNEALEKMVMQVKELTESVHEKSAVIESLKSEVDCLTQKLRSLETDFSVKTEEASKLQEELEGKSVEMHSLEKEVTEMKESLANLENAENQSEKLKLEVKTNEEMVEVFKNKMHALEEEIRFRKSEEETWTQKFAVLHEDIDNKVVEIEKLKKEVDQLSQSKNVSISNQESKPHPFESPVKNSDELKEILAAKQQLIKEIQSLKPEYQADKIPVPCLVQELMTTIMEKQREIFTPILNESETLKKENQYFKSKENDTKKWIDDLEQENTKLQTSLKQKEVEISVASEKLSILTQKLENESDVVATLQSQLDSKVEGIAALELQVVELKEMTSTQQTEAELKLQDSEINKLNSECNDLRCKLLKEEDTVVSLRKLIEERTMKLTELNDEYVKLKGELAEVQLNNESLNKIITCKDDEISVLKEKLEQNILNIGEANEVKDKYNLLVKSKDALLAEVAALQQEINDKTEQNSSLADRLTKKEEEVSNLIKNTEEKTSQIASLTCAIDDKKSIINQLEASLEQERSKMNIQKDSNAESEKIKSLNTEIKSLKDALSKHKLDQEASKGEMNKLKQQVNSLLEEIKLMESKLQIEKNRTAIQVSEVKVLEEEKKKILTSLQQLQEEKTALANRLEKLQTSFETSICSPSSESKKADPTSTPIMFKRSKQCEKLNRKNASLEKKMENLMEKEGKLKEVEESLRALLPSQSPSTLPAMVSLLKQKLEGADGSAARVSRELLEKDKKIEELAKIIDHNKEKMTALNAALKESEDKRKTLDEECVLTWQQCVSLEKDYAEALRREGELKRKLHESTTISESVLAEGDMAKLKDEKNALMKENQELVGQLRSVKNEKRQMVQDFYRAKAKVKESEAELVQLRSQVEALEKENHALDAKNSSLKAHLIQVTDEKENLSTNLNVLLCKYDKLETDKNTATDDQLSNLKSQIQKLKTELADKTAKITMLELQIQSENFPYRGKVAELETNLASYKKKCEDLRSQLRRYQASIQESTLHECPQCVSRRTKTKSEIGVQTMATLQLDGEMSSIVQNNAEAVMKDRVKKLEREHETMKRLCRMRASKISTLEQYIKQNNLPVPDSKENPESASARAAKTVEKESSFSSRRVLTEIPGANLKF